MPEKSNRKKKIGPADVGKRFQETSISWYRGQKQVAVHTTNNSDICLLRKRGWEEVGGAEGAAALPYLIFRIPRRALTIRSKRSVKG